MEWNLWVVKHIIIRSSDILKQVNTLHDTAFVNDEEEYCDLYEFIKY